MRRAQGPLFALLRSTFYSRFSNFVDSGRRKAWFNPPASGAGDRRFKSGRPDLLQYRCGQTVRQRPVKASIGGSTPPAGACICSRSRCPRGAARSARHPVKLEKGVRLPSGLFRGRMVRGQVRPASDSWLACIDCLLRTVPRRGRCPIGSRKVAGYGWPGRTANAVFLRGMGVRIPCLPHRRPDGEMDDHASLLTRCSGFESWSGQCLMVFVV